MRCSFFSLEKSEITQEEGLLAGKSRSTSYDLVVGCGEVSRGWGGGHCHVRMKVKSESESKVVSNSVIPWTVADQAPPSLGFSRQEYWSGLPLPSPGDLPNPVIEPGSPAL